MNMIKTYNFEIHTRPPRFEESKETRMQNHYTKTLTPWILLLLVGGVAWAVGSLWPVLGAPLAAILLGAGLASGVTRWELDSWFKASSRKLLLASVVMLGFEMDLHRIFAVGKDIAGFMLATVIFALTTAWIFSRLLRLHGSAAILVGVGTSICGGSAIMAAAGVIRAKDEDVVQALSTIFLFNILAAILFPIAGHALGLDQHSFGLWAGTAINDTSSVLAATFSYGDEAGRFGMIVKLTRTLMILPVSIFLAVWMHRQSKNAGNLRGVIPWPIIGFTLAATAHFIIGNSHPSLWHGTAFAGRLLMVFALASIGLVTNLAEIWRKGRRALGVGALTWGALSLFSLFLVKLI